MDGDQRCVLVVVGDAAVWRGELERAVGPVLVVVVRVHAKDSFDVSASEDEDAIEAVVADGAHPTFGEGVRVRCLHGSPDHFDLLGAKDLVEGAAELCVPVVDQQSEAAPLLAELHGELAGFLGDPGTVGVRCARDELDSRVASESKKST
jgi:hypothetical protein